MEIYRPNPQQLKNEQKLKREKNRRPRGAVLNSSRPHEEKNWLRVKKQVSDAFKNIERVTGVLSPRVIVVTLVLATALLVNIVVDDFKTNMPIEKVSVKGDFRQLDQGLLENALSPLVGSNYFDLDVKNIKERLLEFSWVQSVEVRKVWPAKVDVLVKENRAIARWGNNGLVNENGKVFYPEFINPAWLEGLPDLDGGDKQSRLVLNRYASLSEVLSEYELSITEFALIADSYWQLTLNNKTEIFLSKEAPEMYLKTFLKAYESDLKNYQLSRVDMRYPNGFSVKYSESQVISVGDNTPSSKSKVRKHHG